jgi:hypothetical protein
MGKPKISFKAGNIKASVFENKATKNGKEFKFDTIQLQRSYKKDENSDWVNESINLRKTDLSKLLVVLGKVQEYVFINSD